MKGQKAYAAASTVIDFLHSNYKTLPLQKKQQHYKQYLKLLQKAAYAGHPEAQFDLGCHYQDENFGGTNPDHNEKKCFYWFTKACEGGVPSACNNLGVLYEYGRVCPQDFDYAQKLYQKAIKKDNYSTAKSNYRRLKRELKMGKHGTPISHE